MNLQWFPFQTDLEILVKLPKAALNVMFCLQSTYLGNGVSAISANQIRAKLMTTDRTIYRGLAALEKAGVGKRSYNHSGNQLWLWHKLIGQTSSSAHIDLQVPPPGVPEVE